MMKIKEGYKNFIKAFLLIITIGFCLDILSECSNEISNIRNLINTFISESIWFGMAGALLLTMILYKKAVEEDKIKKSILNEEIWNTSKIGLIIGAASLIVSRISLESIEKLIGIVSENVLLIYIIITAIVYFKIKLIYKKVSTKKFLEIISDIYLHTTYLVLFSTSIYGFKYFVFSFIFVMILIGVKNFIKEDESSNKTKELYDERKQQLKSLNLIIKDKRVDKVDGHYAIALCGEWGSGKSEFLKAYRNEYKDEYYFIFIKPMIRCSIDSFINQFSSQLKAIMNREGIYNNFCDAEKYFEEISKVIGEKIKVPLNDFIFNKKDKDSYLEYKEKTQKSINYLADCRKKKLVVIIDDFDRLEQENQQLVVSFVKEIVDFDNCITIFGLDFNCLREQKKISLEYLEKFVDKKIELYKIPLKRLLEVHGKEVLSLVESENKYIKVIKEEIKENSYKYYSVFRSRLLDNKKQHDKLVKLMRNVSGYNEDNEKEKEVEKAAKIINDLEDTMINSRRVIHFFDAIRDSLKNIEEMYLNNELIMSFLKEVDVSKIIYWMNFIREFKKDLFLDISKAGGLNQYIENAKNAKKDELLGGFLNEIAKCFILNKQYRKNEEHFKNNIIRFVDSIFFNANFINSAVKVNILSTELFKKFPDNKPWKDKVELDKLSIGLLEEIEEQIEYSKPDRDDKVAECIKEFMELCFYSLDKNKISNKEFLGIIDKNGLSEWLYAVYTVEYLGKITERLRGLSKEEKKELDSKMERWEEFNVIYHKWVLIQIVILFNIKLNISDVEYNFKSTSGFDEVLRHVLECIDCEHKDVSREKAIKIIENKLENCKEDGAILLRETFKSFVNNERVIKSIIDCNEIIEEKDPYIENMETFKCTGWLGNNIKELEELKENIVWLSKEEQELDQIKIMYFYKLLSTYENEYNLSNGNEEITKNFVSIVKEISKRINKDKCRERDYNSLLILINRLEKMKKHHDKKI